MNKIYTSNEDIENACYAYLKEHESIGEKWGKKYHFYYPASTKYGHHQWLWDSGWHMITWSHKEVSKLHR